MSIEAALLLAAVVALIARASGIRLPKHGRVVPGQEKTPTQTNQDRERNRRRGNHGTKPGG